MLDMPVNRSGLRVVYSTAAKLPVFVETQGLHFCISLTLTYAQSTVIVTGLSSV